LIRIESSAFSDSSLQSIEIPRSVQFIAGSAFACSKMNSISIENGNGNDIFVFKQTCPEFDRWKRLCAKNMHVDFRRIHRVSPSHLSFSDRQFDLSVFNEITTLNESHRVMTDIHRGLSDGFCIIVKSIDLSESVELFQIEKEIEMLKHLRHPCIAGPIGFVVPQESGKLKMIRSYMDTTLSEVLLASPHGWTATTQAKAVVGLVLALRFVHSLGLLHGNLKASNVLFDADGCIQIADFCMNRLSGRDSSDSGIGMGGFYGEEWTPKGDVRGFALILFEMIVGHLVTETEAAKEITTVPLEVPMFVSEIIREELSTNSKSGKSFGDIFDILKQNEFQIFRGVDSAEVSVFVNQVELAEQSVE
jgi:serine/threonine protein kinase